MKSFGKGKRSFKTRAMGSPEDSGHRTVLFLKTS